VASDKLLPSWRLGKPPAGPVAWKKSAPMTTDSELLIDNVESGQRRTKAGWTDVAEAADRYHDNNDNNGTCVICCFGRLQ